MRIKNGKQGSKKNKQLPKTEKVAIKDRTLHKLAAKKSWEPLLKKAAGAPVSVLAAVDDQNKMFLEYTTPGFKKRLFEKVSKANDASKEDKQQLIVEQAIRQNHFTVLDNNGELDKECLFSHLLNSSADSFRLLYQIGLSLQSKVPGCPKGKTFFDYYCEQPSLGFLKFLSNNVDNLAEFGLSKMTLLNEMVRKGAGLSDIDTLLSKGACIGQSEDALKELKEYLTKFKDNIFKRKIENTIAIFENLHDQKKVAERIKFPHYSNAFNKEGNTVVHELVEKGYEAECLELLELLGKKTPLYNTSLNSLWHICVKKNLLKVLKYLIDHNIKKIETPNANGLTPWALAVSEGKIEIANLLKSNRANIAPVLNEYGHTLLHNAVLSGDDELINRCYDCKVPMNVPDQNGYTPLYYGGLKKDAELYQFLGKFPGAGDAQAIDLFNAVIKGDVAAVQALLALGVSPNLKNGLKRSPLDEARIHQKDDIASLLKKAGGKSRLSTSEIEKIKKQYKESPQAVDAKLSIEVVRSENGPTLIITECDVKGRQLHQTKLAPWDTTNKVDSHGKWKVINHNDLCYVLLTNEANPNQPELACLLSASGDINLQFANLPKSHLNVSTYGDFSAESIAYINQLTVNANKITSSKQCKFFNGSSLTLSAENIDLDGTLSFSEADITAKNEFKQPGDLITEKLKVSSGSAAIQGQAQGSKQFSVEVNGTFNLMGQLVTGHKGTVKAHNVQLHRNSAIIAQQGELNIHGAARVNNSGAIIADQVYADSNIIITNNVGALIKGLNCILHAPQVNQAGFLLSGQKSTMSYVDWGLNGLHAAVNVAELCSYLPTPNAAVLRSYLLLAKVLYRGGVLLNRAINGDGIQNSEFVSFVLDNVVPSLGILGSSEEKATLLVNVLYQFYGAYYSEDKFIYKSLEIIESLTRAASVYSGGLLTPENMQFLQTAATIVQGSRHALKVAEASLSAYQAWNAEDQKSLEKAQDNLKSITEVMFREALYKLKPSELLGFNLGVQPLDVVNFILNQGHTSELYLQSVVYGVLHAAQRSGMVDPVYQGDLELSAKLLFRMKHWHNLFKDYQDERLSTSAVLNEALNSMMVMLSSEKVREYIDRPAYVAGLPSELNLTPTELATQLNESSTKTATTDASKQEEPVKDIPASLSPAEVEALQVKSLEDHTHTIPEHPKQVLTIDVEETTEKRLAELASSSQTDELSTTLLKSLIEVQKAVNGEYAAQGYLGVFVSALHNEGIIDVTGNIGLSIGNNGTNNSVIKSTQAVGVYGQDVANRKPDGSVLSQKIAESINTNFRNLESGSIDAREAIYLTCLGLIENLGELKTLGRIKTTANRIIKNHQSGRIIAKKDIKLLCDLLAKNEGFIIGETVDFEGARDKAVNAGTIIGVEKIRMMSEKLTASTKGSKLVSKRVNFESAQVEKEGAVQAEIVKTLGSETATPDKVTWRKDEDDNIGVAVLKAKESYDLDKEAFNKVQLLDVTLTEPQVQSQLKAHQTLFDISPDFSNILQLHLAQSDREVPIWQLPKMQTSATFILDAPGSRLFSAGAQQTYGSALHFIGNRFDYAAQRTEFLSRVLFDVKEIDGLGATNILSLKEGGLFQADRMRNFGYLHSDDILFWNVGFLQNDAQQEHSTAYFAHNYKYKYTMDACPEISVVENSGTIDALGQQGHIDTFNQLGGAFRSGVEGNWIYFGNSVQEAILTQVGVNPTGGLHDTGQNWYVNPVWHNAEISSKGRNIFIGSGAMHAAGLSFWGDELSYLSARKGVLVSTRSQPYHIDKIESKTKRGRVQAVMHQEVNSYRVTQNDISSDKGEVVVAAPEGSIRLANTVLSSAGSTTLVAKDEVSVSGITLDKQSSYDYKVKKLLSTKKVSSSTQEQIVYSSFIFTGGELIVRCHDFSLSAVQGAISGADIVANKTTLSGQTQTYKNTTVTKEFSIGVPGQDLVSVLKGHNAKAIFNSILSTCGWDQKELENLLNAKSVTELPKPLLNTARNAWNLTALVAHACSEYGGSPSDFVGAFTDKMGLTSLGENGVRSFNPRFTINTSKTIEETQSSQSISTNLFVGGTFRLLGNELHLLDGATVDAEHLRIFLTEGIKATKGVSTYSYTSKKKDHSLGMSVLNPEDVSLSVGRSAQTEQVTDVTVAELHARGTAHVNGGKLIEGELKISGDKGGKVTAEVMNFTTPQSTRVLRSRSRRVSGSTAGAVSAQLGSQSQSEATTKEKAGVYLPEGEVSADKIHLGSGSKIQTGQLTRKDGQEGLPTVTGTAAQDHSKQSSKSVSFNLSPDGEPSGDIDYSRKETETVHRPTVLADNISPSDLPGVNTLAEKETEVTSTKSDGFAVAGFIPNKDKLKGDVAAMKKTAEKGLLWMFNREGDLPLAGKSFVQASQSSVLDLKETTQTATQTQTRLGPILDDIPNTDLPPIYQFGAQGALSTPLLEKDLPLIPFNWVPNNDKFVPIYQAKLNEECPFVLRGTNKETVVCFEPSPKKPHEQFRLPSAVPAYDQDPVWNHIFSFCRGVEKARDLTTDALLHPIETVMDTGTLVWDGYSALADLTFGISTKGSRERNAQRGNLYNEMLDEFDRGDSSYRTEALSELGVSMIFGGALNGGPRKAALITTERIGIRLYSLGLEPIGFSIKTPFGYANQEFSLSMLKARSEVKSGEGLLYRAGTSGKSRGAEGQFWATISPTDETYAIRHGIPEANAELMDFAMEGKLKPGSKLITRSAPGHGRNPGGGVEVVVEESTVNITNKDAPFSAQKVGSTKPNSHVDSVPLGALLPEVKSIESKRKSKAR